MKTSASRRSLLIAVMTLIAVSALALATPWAEPFRRAIRPRLPLYVVVLASFSAIAQLVMGVVQALSRRGAWRTAALPLSLGSSALCMALAFLPNAPARLPRLFPIVGAALFAITAAALQRRARERSEL